jgi:hypothetical protein
MWWNWKGDNPDPMLVAFMNKTYPTDWTYADFAPQFRAELYGEYKVVQSFSRETTTFFLLEPNEWADILAASGAK